MSTDKITIRGARQHNLKNIDLEIPRDKLVVITGLSGSGKSSLAFDTIYAEGQRRYVESLSAYARQFLGQMDKPDVDFIEGLSPAISIDQKTTSKNPRSTVGTVTEIYDYLRLLYARVGQVHCYQCGKPITQQTVDQIVDQVLALPERTRIQVLAPVIRGRKGEYRKLLEDIRKDGYVRVMVDSAPYELGQEIPMEKNKKHDISIVIDRLIIKDGIDRRLADSVETALRLAEGLVLIDVVDGEQLLFSEKFACPDCGISLEELSPRMFSFNTPYGACPTCDGLGFKTEFSKELLLDYDLSIKDGGIRPWSSSASKWYEGMLQGLATGYGVDLTVPLSQLSEDQLDVLLYGTGNEKVAFTYQNRSGHRRKFTVPFEGLVPNLNRRLRETDSEYIREELGKYMVSTDCPECDGSRLRRESRMVTIGGLPIHKLTDLSVTSCKEFLDDLVLSERDLLIARQILKEIKERLGFLVNVGLGYLTLSRMAGSLSGGEAQRIRLATQIGSGLTGVLYILDEPSIGLHQRDNRRLLDTLFRLRDQGNTLIVVEHDEETIRSADYVVDIGPGAGIHGGEIIASGSIDDIQREERSITGQYLNGTRSIQIPTRRRQPNGKSLRIVGASEHNLKNIDVDIPLGLFICVTGVSGSGKSTLVNDILFRSLAQRLYHASERPGAHQDIKGLEHIDKIINIDQSPIGRTPRSNPATYTGVFTYIRELFSATADAKVRGYQPGRFSFNVKGGRCEACKGDGVNKIEMHFLPDVYVPCEVCKGKRYNRETLDVRYKGKNISDVLEMQVEEAVSFFENIPRIKRKMQTLHDVGLDYVRLGQPATELSGGEAQRVKLATELSKRSTGKTLYILDEPTTGLHIYDVQKLLEVLHRLVEAGDTVLVIEHNLDVIKTADYIIDLGPEGGDQGGEIVAYGTPEKVAETEASYTGQYLRQLLHPGDRRA